MFITDSQVHIWGPNTSAHPWSPFGLAIHDVDDVVTAQDLIAKMDGAGVERAVIVTPSWFPSDAVSLQAVADYPGRFGVMGSIDIGTDPKSLAMWREQPGMLGFRLQLLNPEIEHMFDESFFDPYFEVAEQYSVPVMVFAPKNPAIIEQIATRYPDLRIAVDHLNVPGNVRIHQLGEAIERLMPLSRHPNVAVKLSALPVYASDDFPYRSLHPHILRVIDLFGVERCMWGSDVTRLKTPYEECVRLITESIDFLSMDEKQMIMSGSIENWLDWPHSPLAAQ